MALASKKRSVEKDRCKTLFFKKKRDGGNSKVVRVGIIGVGLRGQHSYEQILCKDPRVKIVAVSDYRGSSKILAEDRSNKDYHLRYSKDLGATYHADHKELLKREDIDIVSLMCEPSRALELGKECIDAGKHVLRDKPMTKYSFEALELAKYAVSKQRLCMLALPLRFHSILREVKNSILSGRIGDVTTVNMGYIWTNGPLEGFKPTKDYLDAYGRGDVLTAGYHAIDFLNWIVDARPVSVYAMMDAFFFEDYKKAALEDFGQLLIQYENNVIVNLTTGRCTARQPAINWLDVSGTDGSLDIKSFRSHVSICSDECCEVPYDPDPLMSLGKQIVDSVILENGDALPNGFDAALTSAVLEAAYRSNETKSEAAVKLPPLD